MLKPTTTIAAAAALIALAGTVAAQDWPTRPITLVVPFAPGGGIDVSVRIQAQHMSEILGQSIIVENLGGAAGMTGALRVAKAAPDGYTFLIGNTGTHAFNQTLYKKPLYNAATDFTPVGLVSELAADSDCAQGSACRQPAGIRRLRAGQPQQDAVRLRRRRLGHASALCAPQPRH